MSMNSVSSQPKTPLDYIAQGYWQDFLTARPIAGGIAYEAQLQECQLDESLLSLQRVDTLMTQIRRDISKSASLNEDVILSEERYRNLLLFLAFYAGRVLAKQWQSVPHWYSQFEIEKRYPDLALISDDFYQYMAVTYDNNAKNVPARLFFALEPIGLRLFGSIDRQFLAVQGGYVASGLYQAVSARLPDSRIGETSSIKVSSTKMDDNQQTQLAKALKKEPAAVAAEPIFTIPVSQSSTVLDSIIKNPVIEERLIMAMPVAPTSDIFTQLLLELEEIEVPQTAGQQDYRKACSILNQFERHISKQDKPRAQVRFSDQHQSARRQALGLLKKSAHLGNTAAMTRLAMYELLNEGLNHDKTAAIDDGIEWVKQAAHNNDSRAQRLLSKMYYQGIGVTQDMSNGQHWLTQAAHNGHIEAAQLVAQWEQAQALINTQNQEQHSIKRYQIWLSIIVIASLLVIIFV